MLNAAKFLLGLAAGLLIGMGINATLADDDWTTGQKLLFGTYVAASAYDAAQTIQAMDARHPNGQPKYVELNPILGSNPGDAEIIGVKVGMAALLWWAADALPRQRTTILWLANAIQISVVAHNASIGMEVKF